MFHSLFIHPSFNTCIKFCELNSLFLCKIFFYRSNSQICIQETKSYVHYCVWRLNCCYLYIHIGIMSFCKAFNLLCSYGEIHTILVKLPLNQDICINHDFCIFLFNTCINKKQSTISPSFRNINPNWEIGTETLEPVQKPLNPWFIRLSKDALTRKPPVFISELTICWTRW